MRLKKTYDQVALHAGWEAAYRGNARQDRLNESMLDRMLQVMQVPPAGLVLDAGCGVGDHTMRLARRGYRCVAADISERVLGAARARAQEAGVAGRVWFINQALEDLALRPVFDAVHCRGVLMHIPEWERALAALCGALRPGGAIAIVEGNQRSVEAAMVRLVRMVQSRRSRLVKTNGGLEFWSSYHGEPFVVRMADPRALRRALRAQGIRVVSTFAAEFWDIHRIPTRPLREAAISYNRAYFKLRLPAWPSAGNVIIGVKTG